MTTDKYLDDLRLDKEYEQINHPNGVTTWKTKPKHKEQAMNREDIIRWATQCKMPYDYVTGEIVQIEKLEAFAALVAAAAVEREREACASVCEEQEELRGHTPFDCAAAIRARSKQ